MEDITAGSWSVRRKAWTHKSACQKEMTFPSSISPTATLSHNSSMFSARPKSSCPFWKTGHDDWRISVSRSTISACGVMQPSRIWASTCTGNLRNEDDIVIWILTKAIRVSHRRAVRGLNAHQTLSHRLSVLIDMSACLLVFTTRSFNFKPLFEFWISCCTSRNPYIRTYSKFNTVWQSSLRFEVRHECSVTIIIVPA